jgi:hypothetical protein
MPQDYVDLAFEEETRRRADEDQRDIKDDFKPDNLLKKAKTKEGKIEVAQQMVDEWNESGEHVRNLMAQWEVSKAQKKGMVGAYVQKEKDTHTSWIPLGTQRSFTGMNKAARLCRRLRSQLFADPPVPEVSPENNTESERDAATFSARLLQIANGPNDLDLLGTAGEAYSLGDVYGSGFRHFRVNPKGGGHRPMEILATEGMQTLAEALENPGDNPVVHYVDKQDMLHRQLPEDPKRVWLPRIEIDLLTGKNCRFIPHNTRNVGTADGLMIGTMVPLRTIRKIVPDIEKLTEEEMEKIVAARPADWNDLIPYGKRHIRDEGEDRWVFVLVRYHKLSGDYPFGAYLMAIGDSYLAVAQDWYDHAHEKEMYIPVDQFGQYYEEDNPYFQSNMEILGPGNEIRAQMMGTLLEHLDKFRNRKTYVPLMGNYQAWMNQFPTATLVPIAPGTEPKTEEMPDFPQPAQEMFNIVTEDMDDDSGLNKPGQGMESPQIESGKHAQQLIEQVIMGLSELRDNTARGVERGWRIVLQLMRAYYSVPQMIGWKGEDGQQIQKRWTGADLTSGQDIRIQRGSMTLFTSSMKTQLVAEWTQMGWMGLEEGKALVSGKMQEATGLEDNPHRMRVRRSIKQWLDGPPAQWQEPQPQIDPQTNQPAVDPQTGEPLPPPPDPIIQRLFQPLPVDLDPEVARLRAWELGKAMVSVEAQGKPGGWQKGLHDAYTMMRKAAGIYTLDEQAEMQQQAQEAQAQEVQAQQEAAQQQQETKLQEGQMKASAEVQKAQIAAQRQAV